MTRTLTKLTLIALTVTLTTVGVASAPTVAYADDGCDEDASGDEGAFRKVERNGETVYEYTGVIRVCGKVPKPNVVVILLEKTIDYEWERLKQDFLPKIHQSLKKAPF